MKMWMIQALMRMKRRQNDCLLKQKAKLVVAAPAEKAVVVQVVVVVNGGERRPEAVVHADPEVLAQLTARLEEGPHRSSLVGRGPVRCVTRGQDSVPA